ncbi:hypothetical protein JVT61DRAFT_14572 [Boletus reticuloceps]|uniref:Uncharacterized protein n=1 Tax=Boletus reticuloceps TaxID=495285 RepID=A0A8I2YCL7_9AGAM|nr:hypothetical protein JVT61DRAFT_14833 [Boletus reticuloceps]KAG6377799.1 hypothetical protein JVT61DRAFT_14572 [Boletus reticuloceps]
MQQQFVQPERAALAVNVIYLLLGIYGYMLSLSTTRRTIGLTLHITVSRWEYLQSFHVEWSLINGRSAFRLSLIPYILGRVCTIIYFILLAAGTSPYPMSFSCIPSALAIASSGNISVGCSSTNFIIRTWVIWKDSRLMQALIVVLALAQWTLLAINVVNIRSISVDFHCVVYENSPQINAATLIYTTFFDLLMFVLSIVGLSSQRCESPLKKRLRAQGILYCAVAGASYIPPMVFALLHNAFVFGLVSNVAIAVSAVASSRAVRSLHFFNAYDPEKTLQSNIALTTQIAVQHTEIHEDILNGRHCIDEAVDQC